MSGSQQARRSRKHFTKVLQELCRRLDAQSDHEFDQADPLGDEEHYQVRFKQTRDSISPGEGSGLENPGFRHEALQRLAFSRLLIAPPPTRPGPNGLLEIRRGPNHPLNLAGAVIGAHLLTTEAGHPYLEIRTRNWHTAHALSLFDTQAGIERPIERSRATSTASRAQSRTCVAPSILDAMSYADILEISDANDVKASFGLTYTGRHFIKNDEDNECAAAQTVITYLRDEIGRGPAPDPMEYASLG